MDEISLLKAAFDKLWTAFVVLGAFVWRGQNARIERLEKKIEETMYTKNDAADRRKDVDAALEALRHGEITLHERLEDKHNQLATKLDHTSLMVARIAGKLGVDLH